MTTDSGPNLRLTPTQDSINNEWTMEKANLHFYDYGFDEYNTEIISLEAKYEHRPFIMNLEWEETHRQWTGDAWQLDFVALDTAVQHFVENGFPVSIAVSELRIFLSDYEAPFLEAYLPDEPLPDTELPSEEDDQLDLGDFE